MVNLIECLSIMADNVTKESAAEGADSLLLSAPSAAAASLNADLVLESGASSSGGHTFSQCVSTWLIKTHTHFHNSEELVLPWYFGALCWSYAVGGIVMMLTRPKWTRESSFPFRAMAWMLILVQGKYGARVLCFSNIYIATDLLS